MKNFTQFIIFLLLIPILSISQASLNMVQIGNLSYNQDLNDIWGYVDHDGNEHALVGCANGFSYVDISNPSNPEEVFFISGSNSVWRDLKTWNNYAYVTTEAADGLLIVDLDDLSGQTYTYWTDQFMRAHNIYIDENGFAYIFGSQDGPTDGAIILDLNTDPMNPSVAGLFDAYYLHDGMVRGDTLWGAAVYEGVLTAVDVSDKANPVILGSTPTSCNFTHNAWVSDDGNYVFTTDEQSDCNVGAYDVSNISDIQQIDLIQSWNNENGFPVIPHNTHVLGDYLVTSYYTSGVTVIDASDPFNMVEIAYYDTSPDYEGGEFEGCWGAYPFLPSGLILASDQQTGLHILEIAEPVYGCTNENASNYNPDANTDDGSCLIVGCTDPTAENFDVEANVENNDLCIYLCDQYIIYPPNVQTEWVVDYGDVLNIEAEADGDVFWMDDDQNIINNGLVYVTDPIIENTTFFVYQEQVVSQGITQNIGEVNHVCDGGAYCDYSGTVYNGGLRFQALEEFTLNSVKVYTGTSGERTIQLMSPNLDNVFESVTINVPESEENGVVIDLNWTIPYGEYIITTDADLNNSNFGDNNPLFKRTTGGLPTFPYIIDDVVSINEGYFNDYENGDNPGFSPAYYYYFYDWEIGTPDEACTSPSVEVNITVHQNSNILENSSNKIVLGVFDLFGRKVNSLQDNQIYFKLFENGEVSKEYIIK